MKLVFNSSTITMRHGPINIRPDYQISCKYIQWESSCFTWTDWRTGRQAWRS